MPFRNDNESLFEESRMSFGQHLEELRVVLIRSLIGVAIGCIFGFLFAERVVNILQQPLEQALTKFYVNDAKQNLRETHGYLAPEWQQMLEENKRIPETVMIDPAELVGVLKQVDPNFMAGGTVGAIGFQATELSSEQVIAICDDWANLNTKDKDRTAQLKFLWSGLNSSEQQLITGYGGKQELTLPELAKFAEILNGLLARQEIYKSKVFEPLIANPGGSWLESIRANEPNAFAELKERLDSTEETQENTNEELADKLNRMLIAAVFENRIPATRDTMVELRIWKPAQYRAQSLGATDPFMIWLKAGVVTGLLFASPWVFFQLWTFVAAGLYPTEQNYIYFFLPVSLLLFFSGVLLAFFFVFEPVLDFLFSFNARMKIAPQPRINDWLSFVMFLPLGFGIAFQLPLVMLFVNRIDLVSVESYLTKWRIAVVAIFGLSMVLTPADPVSMILLAVPLSGLYFLGILLCKWLNKPTNPFAAAAE